MILSNKIGLNNSINKAIYINNSLLNNSNIIVELGQSNSSGQSGDTDNVDYPFTGTNGTFWDGTNEIQLVTDRGSSNLGSEANYFADKYFNHFGVSPMMVERAVSSTGMSSKASSTNWGANSSLRGRAESQITIALAHRGDIEPKAVLWVQGETDAKYYDNYTDYQECKDAMQSIIDWWLGLYPTSVFLISEIGNFSNNDYQNGVDNVRQIQNEVCEENERVFMAFQGCKNFFSEGKMIDFVHYNYIGLKEVGEAFADKLKELE